jgi:hypothetical protein
MESLALSAAKHCDRGQSDDRSEVGVGGVVANEGLRGLQERSQRLEVGSVHDVDVNIGTRTDGIQECPISRALDPLDLPAGPSGGGRRARGTAPPARPDGRVHPLRAPAGSGAFATPVGGDEAEPADVPGVKDRWRAASEPGLCSLASRRRRGFRDERSAHGGRGSRPLHSLESVVKAMPLLRAAKGPAMRRR